MTESTREPPDGSCQTCGAPGWLRHFPGASPTSGIWCERHYWRLLWLHPLGHRGRVVWAGLVVALIVLMAFAR
jgi:hypothetical protein